MKKGFTLVEMLAVLIILGILFGISVVLVFPLIDSSKETTRNAQINTILQAAYDYSLMHTEILPENTIDVYSFPLALLKSESLIETDILDPSTGMAFSDDLLIRISKNLPGSYRSSEYKKQGNYYYTIVDSSSSPRLTIRLSSYNSTVNIDASGSAEYTMPTIISVLKNDANISEYESCVNIVKDNRIVPKVDLTTYGVYKITYTVYGSNGIGLSTINVTVNDTASPTLTSTFQSSQTINVGQSINLKDGITCSDNSNKCRIKIEGKVNKDKVGTYNIKYTALDDAGNVSEPVYRIIRVVESN